MKEVPEDVRQAAAVLGAWLKDRARDRARAVGRVMALSEKAKQRFSEEKHLGSGPIVPTDPREDSAFPAGPEERAMLRDERRKRTLYRLKQDEEERQSYWDGFEKGRMGLFRQEADLLAVVRPDLDPEDLHTAAWALVWRWTSGPTGEAFTDSLKEPEPDLPCGLADPVKILHSLTNLVRDLQNGPGFYATPGRRIALMACEEAAREAARIIV